MPLIAPAKTRHVGKRNRDGKPRQREIDLMLQARRGMREVGGIGERAEVDQQAPAMPVPKFNHTALQNTRERCDRSPAHAPSRSGAARPSAHAEIEKTEVADQRPHGLITRLFHPRCIRGHGHERDEVGRTSPRVIATFFTMLLSIASSRASLQSELPAIHQHFPRIFFHEHEVLAIRPLARADAVGHVTPARCAAHFEGPAITPSSWPKSLSYTCTVPTGSTANTYRPSTVKPMSVDTGLKLSCPWQVDRIALLRIRRPVVVAHRRRRLPSEARSGGSSAV